MRIDPKRGKPAVTNWRLLADFGLVSLLAVQPITGRTHQIRVHLAAKGMPLAIDPLYGATKGIMLSDFKAGYSLSRGKAETPLIERLTLHAYQIDLPPEAACPTRFIAKLDKKFAATLKMLTKHNPKGPEAFPDKELLPAILKTQPF